MSDAPPSADTIVSLSSGHLPAGIAVVRLSGPNVTDILLALLGRVPKPRHARYSTIYGNDAEILDRGLALFFPAPASFTGEDCAEFQIHGGRAVVSALLAKIASFKGCRLAEAGEFTRRAFLNGKIDLLAAEATADLIAAETEAQRRFATLNAEGLHAALYETWRTRLIHARAMLEAELDFADESDVPQSTQAEVWQDLDQLHSEILGHLAGYAKAELVRDGFCVVLIGAPNAGKSSLLNALAKRDAAIVTDEPGTTRDTIEVALDLNGIKVRIIDTAGLREATAKAELLGIERSIATARKADLVIEVVDPRHRTRPLALDLMVACSLRVATKCDLHGVPQPDERYDFWTSALTGAGIDSLLLEIGARASHALPTQGELLPWRQRHTDLLNAAARQLEHSLADGAKATELRCEDLRQASTAIGRLTGKVDVEDLLDVIFSQFCIGK